MNRRSAVVVCATVVAMATTLLGQPAARAAGTVVPDTAFAACLNVYLGQAPDAEISTDQLEGLSGSIDCITQAGSIEGAQYLVNVTEAQIAGPYILGPYHGISDLTPLSGMSNLIKLDLEQVSGDLSPLANLGKLTWLKIVGNSLDAVSALSAISGLTNLTTLDLNKAGDVTYDGVTDLQPLSGLTNLTKLDLEGNAVRDVSPLSGLISLTYLDLWGNGISDVSPLTRLSNLEYLNLSNNQITDLSPMNGSTAPIMGQNADSFIARDQRVTLPSVGLGTYLPPIIGLSSDPISSYALNDYSESTGMSVNLQDGTLTFTDPGNYIIDWQSEGAVLNGGVGFGGTFTITVTDAVMGGIVRDPNLRLCLEQAMTGAGLYVDQPGSISVTDLTLLSGAVPTLQCDNRGIASLDGLQYLPRTASTLTEMSFAGNQISDLSPLSGLTLAGLQLGKNNVSDVSPLASLSGVVYIGLSDNHIADMSPLSNLISWGMAFSGPAIDALRQTVSLQDVPVGGYPLPIQAATNDPIVSVSLNPASAAKAFYVELYYWSNSSTVSFSAPGTYTVDWASMQVPAYPQVQDYPGFSGTFTVTVTGGTPEDAVPDTAFATCLNGYLGEVASDPISSVELVGLSGEIYCSYQNISSIEGAQYLTGVTGLHLAGNRIAFADQLVGLTNLTTLDLSYNPLSSLAPVASLLNLEQLYLSGCNSPDISPLQGLERLTSLDLSYNQIIDVSPLQSLDNLTNLNITGEYQLSDISSIGNLTNLESLNMSVNQISDITALSSLSKLYNLTLDYNIVSDISALSGLTDLRTLSLIGNQISNLEPLSTLVNLDSLYIGANHISDISPLSNLRNLTWLSASSNEISDISPLSGLLKLSGLDMSSNQIGSIYTLANLTNMSYLDMSRNQISDISPLSNLGGLWIAYLSNNQISDVSFLEGNDFLYALTLDGNQISDLSSLTGDMYISAMNQQVTMHDTTVGLQAVPILPGITGPLSIIDLNSASSATDMMANASAATISYNSEGTYTVDWSSINGNFSGTYKVRVATPSLANSSVVKTDTTAMTTSGKARLGNGNDPYEIVATVKDKDGNTLTGAMSQLSAQGQGLIVGVFNDNGDGTYSLQIAAANPGVYSVTVLIGGKQVGDPIVVNFMGATVAYQTRWIGENQTVQGQGFLPDEKVTVSVDSGLLTLGTFYADADGIVTVSSFDVPLDFSDGDHTVDFKGEVSGTVTATFNVRIPVTSILVGPFTRLLQPGESQQMSLTVAPEAATDKSVTWQSSSPDVATVDQNGMVTAVAVGTTTINAVANDGSGTVGASTVTVRILVTSLSLSPATLGLHPGDSQQLSLGVLPITATDQSVTWKSSTQGVATVDANGIVTAIANGSATITATANDGSGIYKTATVTVTTPVSSIVISPGSVSLFIGDSKQLNVDVQIATASDKTVTWQSSAPDVATVDQNGLVKAVADGTATITATANDGSGVFGTATVKVTTPVASITVSPSTFGLHTGDSQQLNLDIRPTTATDQSVTWKSSTPGVATVDQTGIVTGVANGSATITATANDGSTVYGTATVTVTTLVSSIVASPTTVSLFVSGSKQLAIAILPSSASDKTVTWSSSAPSVATVDQNGLVKAIADGTATITASANDGSGMFGATTVTVTIPVASISLSPGALGLHPGDSQQLGLGVLPTTATDQSVTWKSSATSVATVDQSGVVMAIANGSATITATANDGSGVSGTASVTVTTLVSSIVVSPGTVALFTAGSKQLSVAVLPSTASNKSVTWLSSAPGVATVDAYGLVKAVTDGTATITATANDGSGVFGAAIVTVTTPVTSITLSPSTLGLHPGDSQLLGLSVLPTTATDQSVTWKSSSSGVATVDQSGVVTAVANGSASITATANDGSGVYGTALVTVQTPVTSVVVSPATLSLELGSSQRLTVTVQPSIASDKSVTWQSSAPGVATVDQSGLVVAVSLGTTTITAVAKDGSSASGSATVTVIENASLPLSVSAQPTSDLAPLTTTITINTSEPVGRPVSYTVNYGDGTTEQGTAIDPYPTITLSHTYTVKGTYQLVVTATNNVAASASKQVAISALAPPNNPPEVDFAVTPTSGVAPLIVQAFITATDVDNDTLTYSLDFGDGSIVSRGTLPISLVSHVYSGAGSYSVRAEVSDGKTSVVRFAKVVVGLDQPLTAKAGDNQTGATGVPLLFDGSQSTPVEAITSYQWDFGDGKTSSSMQPNHVYTAAGIYQVKLTVNSGTLSAVDFTTVTIIAPPPAQGLFITVTSGGSNLAGADVVVTMPDGTRVSGVSDTMGVAKLNGLLDGDVTAYVWANGYMPTTVTTTISNGHGEATAALTAGSAGVTTLDSHRMTLDEIAQAGIDVADPVNYHVYEATINLHFTPTDTQTVPVYVTPTGIECVTTDCIGFNPAPAGSCPVSQCFTSSGGGPTNPIPQIYIPTVIYVGSEPVVQWLVIPMQASFLKEFFQVQMIVQNLTSGFTFDNGTATLKLPSGLSLAPTTDGQSLVQTVEDVPGGESRTATWIVRGDVEGSYGLSADYSGSVEPIGLPIKMTATTKSDLKVWGASALQTTITVDCSAQWWAPFNVTVAVKNVSDTDVYNASVRLLDPPASQPKEDAQYFFAPMEDGAEGTIILKAGEVFVADYTVFAGLGSSNSKQMQTDIGASFIAQTGGDVNLNPALLCATSSNRGNNSGAVNVAVIKPVDDDGSQDYAQVTWDRPAVWSLPGTTAQYTTVTNSSKPVGDSTTVITAPPGTTLAGVDQRCTIDYWNKQAVCSTGPMAAGAQVKINYSVVLPPGGVHIDGYEVYTRQTLGTGEWTYYTNTTSESFKLPVTDRAQGRYYGILTNYDGNYHENEHAIGFGPARYVALGDSYSSGEGVPLFEPGTASDVDGNGGNKCHRSAQGSYSRLVAADVSLSANLTPAEFDACSGAVTADITTPNPSNSGEAAQDTHVNGFTDLITLSMGGNDIGFSYIAEACLFLDCSLLLASNEAFGSNAWLQDIAKAIDTANAVKGLWDGANEFIDCSSAATGLGAIKCAYGAAKLAQDLYNFLNPKDDPRVTAPWFIFDGTLESRLTGAYLDLARKAPNAQIVVVPYPKVVAGDSSAATCNLGFSWAALDPVERGMIESLIDQINGVIRQAVDDANAQLGKTSISMLDPTEVNKQFSGGMLCENGSLNPGSYFNTIVAPVLTVPGNNGPMSYSLHPNALGQQAYARALAAYVNSGVLKLMPNETKDAVSTDVPDGFTSLRLAATWPGSTVLLSAVAPDGTVYDANSPGVTSGGDATNAWIDIPSPMPGTWVARVYGEDVAASGEDVYVVVTMERAIPDSPVASVKGNVSPTDPRTVTFDASGSTTSQGDLTYLWTFSDGTSATGPVVTHTFADEYSMWGTVKLDDGVSIPTWAPVTVNSAPVSTNDDATVVQGQILTVDAAGVLANDTDVDGDTLTAVLVQGPAHGTLTLNSDGSYTYTPEIDFTGVDTFTYLANDGHANSEPATVTINVTASGSGGDDTTPVTSIEVTPSTVSLNPGGTQQLSVTVLPSTASDKSVTWTSSAPGVATVDQTGLVTAVANGSATITATAKDGSGVFGTSTVTVTTPVTSVAVAPTSVSLKPSGTQQLSVTVLPSTASDKSVTWTSSAPDVATVDQSGLVTAVADGSATITATAKDGSGVSGTSEVTVSSSLALVTSVTVTPTSVSLVPGGSKQLSASVAPATASDKSVTWTSSAPGVATVDQTGLVTAVAVGTATITATAKDGSNVSGSAGVTVVSAGNGTTPVLPMLRFTESPDMNGDGRGEVLAVDTAGVLWMYPGLSTGALGTPIKLSQGFANYEIAGPGDVDSDGKADVFAIDGDGTLWLYHGNGTKALSPQRQVGNGWTGWKLIPAGDLTGDGKVDLLSINSAGDLFMYAGKGTGSFGMKKQVGNGWTGWQLYAAGDLNGDGKTDILGINGAGDLFQYAGRGDGTFKAKVQSGNGWTGFTLAAGGDLNGDGLADITGLNETTRVLYVYLGKGSAKFAMKKVVASVW